MSTEPGRRRVFDGLRDRLLALAGYSVMGGRSYEPEKNLEIHLEFKRILSILEEIAARKCDGYGPFRYDELENNWRWEIQALYQDIERKFGRLKNLCRPEPVGVDRTNEILEALSDLSVYSARGIQIIARLEAMRESSPRS